MWPTGAEQAPPDELREALSGALAAALPGRLRSWQQLKPCVYRLVLDASASPASLILKRLDPGRAERNRLVTERWLPRVGCNEAAPCLVRAAADPACRHVWHLYEDLGDTCLDAASPDPEGLRSAVALVAGLHTRSAGQAFLAECRLFGGDLGAHLYGSSARDAGRGLAALSRALSREPEERAGEVVERLRGEAQRLLDEERWRMELIADLGGGESMLHGDLWPANVLFTEKGGRLRARLIDWDHAGAGPASYDISTFISRFPRPQRRRVLELYEGAGGQAWSDLASTTELNLLFDTHERARIVNRVIWPCLAALEGELDWALSELSRIDRWFREIQPLLEDESP